MSTLFLLLVYIATSTYELAAADDKKVKLKPVVVTSSRIYSQDEGLRLSTRCEETLPMDTEEGESFLSVPGALEEVTLVDTRTRGPYGIQSDISIRGAPFEENLVLLDGISVNDPQTGHHNMDLPITLYDIEKIDITYGPASSVYGSGAFGGALNIIPKAPRDTLNIHAASTTGSWDFYSGSASINLPLKNIKSRSSVEWKRGSGFKPETEFNALTASSYTEGSFGGANGSLFLGYLTKKFGADSFYSNIYDNEEESVNTGIIIAKSEIPAECREGYQMKITPAIYWKRLQDKFILDRNRPFFSRNDHTTNLYGGEISSAIDAPFGSAAYGAGAGAETIESTNLGNRSRVKANAFLEYEARILNFLLNTGIRFDYYSTFKDEFSPALGVAYELLPGFSVRARAAHAFRVPTFTELYYRTPANIGNPNLEPETAWNYEVGAEIKKEFFYVKTDVFLRDSSGVIDWTRAVPTSLWRAENIGEFNIYGVEVFFGLDFEKIYGKNFFKKFDLKYSYLESTEKKGIISKYVLEYLKHDLNLRLECNLPFGFKEYFDFRFKKRVGSDHYFLFDSVITRPVKLGNNSMNLFIRLDNIFNTAYCEQGDIEMPGRAIYGGASVEF